MVTVTQTLTAPTGAVKNSKKAPVGTEQERTMKACAEMVNVLIQAFEDEKDDRDVNLNALRGQISKKYKLSSVPPLTSIIAAIPEHYKKYLMPKLMAKPVRA